MIRMPGKSYQGPFLPLSSHEQQIKQELINIIETLCLSIGERNVWQKDSLEASSHFLKQYFSNLGLSVHEQSFTVEDQQVKNIICEKKGGQFPEEILILGAHYDTALSSPGADDNGSGVAGILMLAKLLAKVDLARTLRFVAFVNEEPPFFYSSNMGSWQYASHCKKNKEAIVGMFSIESIGYYDLAENSQAYPFPLNYFYPKSGDFIGFVSNLWSRDLLYRSISLFRERVNFPSEGLSAPSFVPGVGWSDQWAFWRFGYKAVMVTDTALFRNPFYHSPNDLPKTLDYDRLARVVFGLSQVMEALAK